MYQRVKIQAETDQTISFFENWIETSETGLFDEPSLFRMSSRRV